MINSIEAGGVWSLFRQPASAHCSNPNPSEHICSLTQCQRHAERDPENIILPWQQPESLKWELGSEPLWKLRLTKCCNYWCAEENMYAPKLLQYKSTAMKLTSCNCKFLARRMLLFAFQKPSTKPYARFCVRGAA